MTEPEKQDGFSEEYLRIVSHQLQSPLNAIKSLLNTIAEGLTGDINPQALNFVERSMKRADEAKAMISDLLDYELYSSRAERKQEEVDLVPLLHGLIARYTMVASEHNVSLATEIPLNRRVIVSGNRVGLDHAFRNLIDNAIKYTPENGRVKVIFAVDGNCRIEVKDTGYGIPEGEQEKVFEPFYRSVKHKGNLAGTGLGLPIVKKIVEQHGGAISLESREGKGSTFTVVLPFERVEETGEEEIPRKRVLIIGGVTAGPKAAARLRRLDQSLDITIIEKSELLSYSGCGLPAYIGGTVGSPKALMTTADSTIRDVHFFESIKNIRIFNKTLAEEIDRKKKTVKIRNLDSGKRTLLPYDYLILATGAVANVPDVPGIDQDGIHHLHSIDDAESIRRRLTKQSAQDVCIVGGGLIAVEVAESIIATGARVTVLERQPYILASLMDKDIALKLQNELNRKGIKIQTDVNIKKIHRDEQRLVIEADRGSCHTDLIILAAGVSPNAELASKAGLKIGDNKGVQVDETLRTSDPEIYAIGDCAESINLVTGRHDYWPLGSVSTKMGRIAANNIADYPSRFNGFLLTAIVRIFDIGIARTGLTSEEALSSDFEPVSAVITGLDRSHYSGRAKPVVLKIIADKKTRRVLGAQGYGRGDIVSRISTLAGAITSAMTLDDVFQLDLGYSPAFNNPIDILQTACLVLSNKMDGLVRMISLEEFDKVKDDVAIVDVSPLTEHSQDNIPGSISIPLENIRMEDLPFDKKDQIVLYSRTSAGAYEAFSYLVTRSFENLYVLEGGYELWRS